MALEHLFRPFYTTKSGGTGLGLSVSNSIMRQHGGAIEAANVAGGGAVFTLTLPAASDGRSFPQSGAAQERFRLAQTRTPRCQAVESVPR
jgi:hypothetical protein